MLRLIWILRARKPTHLYYLAPFRAQAQVARDQFFFGLLGGVKVIIGLDSKSSRATTHVQMLRVERESQRLLNVVDASCNVDDAVREKLLDIPDEAFRSTIRQLTEANWHQGQRIAAMTIGSKMQSKRWPIDRFIETAQMLLETYPDLFVVLLGNEEEAELASELAKAIPGKAINLSGRTSLLEAAAVLQLASFYIGNDTGTMHLAAAVGTPCVAVFSARDVPGKWEPYGRHHRVLRADVPCAGCMLEVCDKDLACLKGISSTAVMREIRQVEAFTANAPRTGTHEPDANQ
jgi:ADP-heptose:LPS heptosyltransferase